MAPSNPLIDKFILDSRAAGLDDIVAREQLVAAGWDKASIDTSFAAHPATEATPPPPPTTVPLTTVSATDTPAQVQTPSMPTDPVQPTVVGPEPIATNPLTTPGSSLPAAAAPVIASAAALQQPMPSISPATVSAPARSGMIKKLAVIGGGLLGLLLIGALLFFFVFKSDSPEAVFRKMIENNLDSDSYTRKISSDADGSSFDITTDFDLDDEESRASLSEFNSIAETSVGEVTFSIEHIAVQDDDYVRITELGLDFNDTSLQGSLSEGELFTLFGVPDKDVWSEYSPGMAGGFFDSVVVLNGIAGIMPVGTYQKDATLADMIFAAYDIDFESAKTVERDGRELLELSYDGDADKIDEFNDYIFDNSDFDLNDSDRPDSTFDNNDGTIWIDAGTKRLVQIDIESSSAPTLTAEYSSFGEVEDIERPL